MTADPSQVTAWQLLGNALHDGGEVGPVRVADVGITSARAGDLNRARQAFERATELDPSDERSWIGLGRVETAMGEFDAAERSLKRARQLDAETSEASFHTARLIEERARTRGARSLSDTAPLLSFYSSALDSRRVGGSARHHLVRTKLWAGDFLGAQRSAWPKGPDIAAWNSCSAELVRQAVAAGSAPDEWLFAVHATLLHAGHIRDAYDVKSLLARQVADRPPPPGRAVAKLLDSARAHAYIGRSEDAVALLDAGRAVWHSRFERIAVEKLIGDIVLLNGDVERSRSTFARFQRSTNGAAETEFAHLVRGRSVAVVGPAPSDAPAADDLVGFDTIVRTGRSPSQHARTDIAYLSDTIAKVTKQSANDSADTSLVVLRPSMTSVVRHATPHPHLRLMPAEDSNTFNCTHFAIQRILYDLLQYGPSRIILFGVDFFLGVDLYNPNYSRDLDDWYRRNSMQPTISKSVHDYRWDFDYTDRLHKVGLIDTSSHVTSRLSLGCDRYLEELQRRMLGHGPAASTGADAHHVTDTMSRP